MGQPEETARCPQCGSGAAPPAVAVQAPEISTALGKAGLMFVMFSLAMGVLIVVAGDVAAETAFLVAVTAGFLFAGVSLPSIMGRRLFLDSDVDGGRVHLALIAMGYRFASHHGHVVTYRPAYLSAFGWGLVHEVVTAEGRVLVGEKWLLRKLQPFLDGLLE